MKRANGFTIVELLVVIVVIAILATITIVSYNFVKDDALEARRVGDMDKIVKALELYKLKHGEYPARNPDCSDSGSLEASNICPDTFLSALQPHLNSKTPIDPKNSSTNRYRYYRYAAGSMNCDASRGQFYILMIAAPSSDPVISSSPGWSCPDAPSWWTTSGTNGNKWITGSYTN